MGPAVYVGGILIAQGYATRTKEASYRFFEQLPISLGHDLLLYFARFRQGPEDGCYTTLLVVQRCRSDSPNRPSTKTSHRCRDSRHRNPCRAAAVRTPIRWC